MFCLVIVRSGTSFQERWPSKGQRLHLPNSTYDNPGFVESNFGESNEAHPSSYCQAAAGDRNRSKLLVFRAHGIREPRILRSFETVSSLRQVHQTLSQQDLARAQSVANSTLVTDNPDTYGEEVEYWLDTENPGKG